MGDQDLDLFSFAWCQSKIFYLENTGTATVPEFGNSSLQTNPFNINPSGIMSAGASFGDLDDDGDYDLILSGRINRPNKEFLYQENMGSATNPLFGPRIPAPGGMLLPRVFDGYMAMSIFDWDCDGDLDVMNTFLIKNGPNELYFHENNSTDPGTPSFLPAVYTGESVFTTIHGDLDGDGDQDVMAGAKVFRNQTTTCRRGPSPVADFSALVDEGAMAVSFTDHSDTKHTACYPVRWSWHFGDGTRSDEQHPVHTYAQGGTYLVGLVVTDVRGSDTAFQEVNLMPREKTTGIEEAMKLPVKLYPNPVSNWLNIEWNDLSAHQELQLTVYDVYGKPVPTGVIRPGLENQVAVDLSHLPAGLYLIEGRAGERYFSEKVLKVDR
jgi:PKD repeat protein